MKSSLSCVWALLLLLAVVGIEGCSKSPAPAPQAGDFEKPLQSLASAQPAVSQMIEQALTSYRSQDYVTTVTLLLTAKAQPQLAPEQRLVIQGAIKNLSLQLQAQALKGDAKAKEDMHAVERVLSR